MHSRWHFNVNIVKGGSNDWSTCNDTNAHTLKKRLTNALVGRRFLEGEYQIDQKTLQRLTKDSDLLRRHQKSAHNIDTRKRKRRPSPGTGLQDLARREAEKGGQSCPKCSSNSIAGGNAVPGQLRSVPGSLVSSAAAPDGYVDLCAPPPSSGPYEETLGQQGLETLPSAQHSNRALVEGIISPSDNDLGTFLSSYDYSGLDPFDLFGDGDTILENVDFSSLFLPQSFALDQDLQVGDINNSNNQNLHEATKPTQHLRVPKINGSDAEQHSISRFGSPLPSIRSDLGDDFASALGRHSRVARVAPCWKISTTEYNVVKEKLSNLLKVLPNDFVLPSKHTVSRYLEGCINGLYEHMPFLHIPTWSVELCAPELLLTMMAIGAQFRFEGQIAVKLFFAAKSAVMHRLHMSRTDELTGALSKPSGYVGRNAASPVSPRDFQLQCEDNSLDEGNDNDRKSSRLQTMQAIISLMVLGSWGPRQLVAEAIAFQSVLAELVREDGLEPETDAAVALVRTDTDMAWRRWIRSETLRRTKLMAYCFVNLQSVAYNVSPCILTSEVRINTPTSQDEWNAKTAVSWDMVQHGSRILPRSFPDAIRSLFQDNISVSDKKDSASSAIGNYALIFAILQSIFFLREGCNTFHFRQDTQNLRSEDIESLSKVLQRWQSRWESSPESTIDPQSSCGPVAFNSTALLRLAWIRLHSDLGPCRNLASRNPNVIVEAFKSCPPLHRKPGLTLAILHAAHALSVPVRMGTNYVAKTQTLSWSVQHSLCNLECAVFLSKWFDAVASTLNVTPLSSQEIGIIHMIRSIVLETGFFGDEAFALATDEQGWLRLIRHLGTAVASLWAEIFSGTHVFDMVSTIGTSLSIYAKLLEDEHTPINNAV